MLEFCRANLRILRQKKSANQLKTKKNHIFSL